MTEYEILDLLMSNTALMYADGAAFMTLLSAYLVVVHLVGQRLTRFQVFFINFTFIGLAVSSALGWLVTIEKGAALTERLLELGTEAPGVTGTGKAGLVIYFTFRSAVVLGALIYAWQIRRGRAYKGRQ